VCALGQADRGLVAGGHPATVAAAGAVLDTGGNAFDAVVAAGFAAAVAEPQLTGLAGGGFLLARTANGAARVFDFFVDTPGRGHGVAPRALDFIPVEVDFGTTRQEFNVGLGSVAVPGCLAGYLHVHAALGRQPLAAVIQPAAQLARDGIVLNEHHAYLVGLLRPILFRSPEGRAIYSRSGEPLACGERLVNPDLAAFLDRLAASPRRGNGFDAPDLARAIARDMEAGGLLTAEDLSRYEVFERRPLAARFRGREVLTNPPPSSGGTLLRIALELLAARRPPPAWGDPAHVVPLVETMIETDAIRSGAPAPTRPRFGRGTTHVSVCDAAGNVAAMTTSNGESSGYIAPGTGVMFNNMLGEDDLHPGGFHRDEPGLRVASMMSPTLLLRDGRVELVLGSGGSKRIRTAVLQVIQNVVELGMDLCAAVEAPRLHWDGETLQVEPGFPAAALRALEARWPIDRWERRNLYFGGVHAVVPGGQGAGDPRRGGVAVVCGQRESR